MVDHLELYFRLFHDGKILVQGYANIKKKVITKQFAWIETKLTLQKFISDEFSHDAVCNYYLLPIATINHAMIFPVKIK